jgi:hypothetical protein
VLGKQRNRSQSPTRSEPSTRCNFPSLRTFRLAGRGWGTLTRGSSLAWKAAKSFAVPGLLPGDNDKWEPADNDKMEPAGGLCPVPLLSIWAWPILAFVPVEKTERPEKKERITEETRRDEQTEQSVETVEMPRPKSEVPVPESKDSNASRRIQLNAVEFNCIRVKRWRCKQRLERKRDGCSLPMGPHSLRRHQAHGSIHALKAINLAAFVRTGFKAHNSQVERAIHNAVNPKAYV